MRVQMQAMNRDKLLARLRRLCDQSSQKNIADEFAVSQAYLSDVLAGRREPGPAILKGMGLERETVYRSNGRSNLSDER